ncbi:cation diffusion facilitator family transporter [Arcanobacterium buesumense]|uniref:Cation transporter n=1 Tax=Arcanobacterium buesumense TaxID=2722751 RepID=A0A6H2EM26_9ACTO|nr:cation diffusion facilitator family transporter [Arcanobacterium buesumense]QJC22126.1 cation transporter [Arcanobacterium buesumense]
MGHHHSHGHDHGSATSSRARLSAALLITSTVLIVEVIGGLISGSLSLLADAGHMFVDSSGLVVALGAAYLLRRPRDTTYTWGWGRIEIIAAAVQAGMLFLICFWVGYHAIMRLISPVIIDVEPMFIAALIGLVANALSIFVLFGGRHESLNMKAAFLEVLTDTLGSLAVIVSAVIYYATGWERADGVAALFVAILMAPRAVILLRSALRILMEATPEDLDAHEIYEHFLGLTFVEEVHDLHVSTIQTGVVSLTAHIAISSGTTDDQRAEFLHQLEECAQGHFHLPIAHSTFQFEPKEHSEHEKLAHGLDEH